MSSSGDETKTKTCDDQKSLAMENLSVGNNSFNVSSVVKLSKQLCDNIKLITPHTSEFMTVVLPFEDKEQWVKIEKSIQKFLKKPELKQLSETILKYADFHQKCNFGVLESYAESGKKSDCDKLLRKIAESALMLPLLFEPNLRLLVKGEDARVTLKESQICCLLANAFFCTFARPDRGYWQQKNRESKGRYRGSSFCGRGMADWTRNSSRQNSTDGVSVDGKERKMPTINFNSLLHFENEFDLKMKLNKLKCIMNYFDVMFERLPKLKDGEERQVTYHRQVLKSNPDWKNSRKLLSKVDIRLSGTIEDGKSLLQVDFANKLVGGGVLDRGCVQEEIRFAICPELILSRLITEELDDNECLIVTGIERFSSYTGYSKTFEYGGSDKDSTLMDSNRRRLTQLVAIDALKFSNHIDQFCPMDFERDLNKAYCGFMWNERSGSDEVHGVATGHWGCGAFKGDKELKFLIQLLAASQASRDLCYFAFGEKEFKNRATAIYEILKSGAATVGSLYKLIKGSFEHARSYEFSIFKCVENSFRGELSSSYRHRGSASISEENTSKTEESSWHKSNSGDETENAKKSVEDCSGGFTEDEAIVEKSGCNVHNDFF